MERESKGGYLPTLDGWRALAAMGVLCGHSVNSIPGLNHYLMTGFAVLADKSVDLFFGISGLLITFRLLEERSRFGEISLKGFYVRRFCRIIPAAWLYLLGLAALVVIVDLPVNWQAWWGAALFYRNYLHQTDGSFERVRITGDRYTAGYWSLSMEEHFYLIWPTMLVFLGNRRALHAAAWLCSLVFLWRWGVAAHWLGYRVSYKALLHYTQFRFDALLFPAMLAVLLQSPGFVNKLKASFTPEKWFLIAGICLFSILWIKPPPFVGSVLFSIQSVCIPLLIVGGMWNPYLVSILEIYPLRWIGRISYSLYLWQGLFLFIDGPNSRGLLFEILRFVGIFAASCASYYLIERPFMRLGHRLAPPATPGRPDLKISDERISDQGIRAQGLRREYGS